MNIGSLENSRGEVKKRARAGEKEKEKEKGQINEERQ